MILVLSGLCKYTLYQDIPRSETSLNRSDIFCELDWVKKECESLDESNAWSGSDQRTYNSHAPVTPHFNPSLASCEVQVL